MSLAFETLRRGGELLERDEALATLAGALNDARLGQGRLVLVGGEAGAGKTTLVHAFCRRLDRDTRMLTGACEALSTPRPLGPLVDMATESDALTEALQAHGHPSEVFASLHEELAEQPTVLVVEDLHWSDEATFDVLRLLARRMDVPALVVATYRDDALDRNHPLRMLLGDLATAPAVGRISLAPLSRDAVAQLAMGHDVDVHDLYARTGGNPFFVTELLASGDETLPPSARDAVLARAAGLSDDALEVLETVALAVPRAEPWLLEAVAGDRAVRVDDCIAIGLVAADGDCVTLRHELGRAAVEDAMPPTRRVRMHKRILAALLDAAPVEIDPARIAHHAEAAGDVGAVLEHAPAAATRAAAPSCSRAAHAPATSPTTSSRRWR